MAGNVTRKYTHSEFDHAAIIVRFDSTVADARNDVYILEATSALGVSLKRWSHVRDKMGSLYELVVLRHLEMERTDKQI